MVEYYEDYLRKKSPKLDLIILSRRKKFLLDSLSASIFRVFAQVMEGCPILRQIQLALYCIIST